MTDQPLRPARFTDAHLRALEGRLYPRRETDGPKRLADESLRWDFHAVLAQDDPQVLLRFFENVDTGCKVLEEGCDPPHPRPFKWSRISTSSTPADRRQFDAAWSALDLSLAHSPSLWAYASLCALVADDVRPSMLIGWRPPAKGAPLKTKDIANTLNALGGRYQRGRTSAVSNSPFGRLWWQARWCRESMEHAPSAYRNWTWADMAHELGDHRGLWERLTQFCFSQLTTLSHPAVRAGLLWSVMQRSSWSVKDMESAMRRVGRLMAVRNLDVLKPQETVGLVMHACGVASE